MVNFVVWFNCVKDKYLDESSISCNIIGFFDDFLFEIDFIDNVDDDLFVENNVIEDIIEYKLKGGMKFVKRKRVKIIRFVRFNKEKEFENYYRE